MPRHDPDSTLILICLGFHNPTVYDKRYLLHFLPLALLVGRFAPQPDAHKSHPPGDCNPYTCDPDPTSTDLPAAWPFVVSEMPDRHFPLYVHVSEERSFVIDAERKDAMLVWKLECTAEDSAVRCLRNGYEIETLIRRKHGKFKLQRVRGVNFERT